MADNDAGYEYRSVRSVDSELTSAIVQWQKRGWEYVGVSQGRRRPTLTFRRVSLPGRRRTKVVRGGLVALLVVAGLVAIRTDRPADVRQAFDRNAIEDGPLDRDGDGLSDLTEVSGWSVESGAEYVTNPDSADTDGDGLPDGDEAGEMTSGSEAVSTYVGYSNPELKDADDDGLNDAEEADASLDPFDADSDNDGLVDGVEIMEVGSAPDKPDTDGDGYDDGYEESNQKSKGLDPLWVDVKVSKASYVADYAKGAIAGDLWREDSLAWLAGNLTSGASSSIPVVGTLVGGLADARDVIGSAIHGDWVGSGFSAAGALPGGDLVAIPGKAAKFVARNPELAAAVATSIVAMKKVPEKIKVEAAKKIWKHDWEDLRAAGLTNKTLLRLQQRRIKFDRLADALKRPGHVQGPVSKFLTWPEGESYLAKQYGVTSQKAAQQVSASTRGCFDVCNTIRRRFDLVVDGIAHESKVGNVPWSESVERQIRSDAWLIKNEDIKGAYWHFFASAESNTMGPDARVLDLLEELKIPYTIHLPVK